MAAASRKLSFPFCAVPLTFAWQQAVPTPPTFDGAANVRENIAGDVLASGTTMQWNSPAKGWNAGAVIADASLNRRQTIRVGASVAFGQVGIVGFDGQIELEAPRLSVDDEFDHRALLPFCCAAVRHVTPAFLRPASGAGCVEEQGLAAAARPSVARNMRSC
jgi:hypothetical protein